jgi:zinc protease
VPGTPAGERALVPLGDRPNLDVFLGHAAELLVGDDDHPAALLANSCLGQSTLTSRLGAAVRDQAGLTYGVVSRFFCTLHLAGPWAVALSVAGADLDRAEALCRDVIARYADEGPGEEELEDERQALSGSFRVALATNGGVARQLVVALTAGLPVSFLDDYPRRLLATTRDEVVTALRRHVRPQDIVLGAAGTIADRAP